MKPLRETCVPRADVLKGDLEDAIFAADFGFVLDGSAPAVYRDPHQFFRNTHPAAPLRKVVTTVFGRLAAPDEAGAAVRLSTGFGGGKTHALIALWHLAKHVNQATLGTELLPAAGRPSQVAVAGVDGEKLGALVAHDHGDVVTHSLWGELAYQLGGKAAYERIAPQDNPETAPDSGSIRALLPQGTPVLILLDELVKYSIKLSTRGQGALLAFLGSLISEVGARRQAVLVISDPAGQAAYQQESAALAEALRTNDVAKRLDEELGRKTSDYDPIGGETAQVIVRRLFDKVDGAAAQEASAEYFNLYKRVSQDAPDLLPLDVATPDYAKRIVDCYPFHPRLLETTRDRLGAMQDFQKSRGTLRLFARLLRDLWEGQSDVPLVTAGEIDWRSSRVQADLLQRLNRDQFVPSVDADVVRHAGQLDRDFSTDMHRRVASALLLESLPMTPSAAMDKRDLTLATLRPTDVGHEAGEAMDRLISVCWHTYKDDTGRKFQFRYEPNVNKLIEERAEGISPLDARQAVLGTAQSYFGGSTFKLIAYPTSPRAVPENADLKLVLAEREAQAQAVCDYRDDDDPDAKQKRAFRNAILAVAPTPAALDEAVRAKRQEMAADEIAKEQKANKALKQQVDDLLPTLRKRARIRTVRAFNRVVFQGRPSVSLEEKYLVSEDGALQDVQGQQQLKGFLDDKKLIFAATDVLDPDLLIDSILKGATPALDNDGAFTASSVHERALASDKLRLMRDVDPIRNAILKGVERGKLAVRLPNGDVYDMAGCVATVGGRRERVEKKLTTLKLDSDVFVAPMTAPCVAAWTKIDSAVKEGKDTSKDDDGTAPHTTWTYTPETATATSWDAALEAAAPPPLTALKLTANRIEAARTLAALALPFGAQAQSLTVSAVGTLKDGGEARYMVEGVKPNHPLKPLDTAAMLLRAMGDGAELEAELALDFGDVVVSDAAAKLRQAQDNAADGVGLEALFGKESK